MMRIRGIVNIRRRLLEMLARRPGKEPPEHRLRVEVHRSLAEIRPLAPQLDAIALASRRPAPFDTFAYLQAFLANDEHAKPGREVLFLVASEAGSPIGFLPLQRVRERLLGVPHTTLQFLVTHDNDRPRVIARPEDEARCAEAFYHHLLEVERGWDLLQLQEQDAESALRELPRSLRLSRYRVRRFPTNPSSRLALGGRSLSDYLRDLREARPSRATTLEKRIRRLFREGRIELCLAADQVSLEGMFDLYLDLEKRSWKSKVDGHIGRHPKRIAFFRRLLEPDQPMRMGVSLMLLDGLPIAGLVTGTFAGESYFFEEAFDEGFKDLAPGNVMTLLLVRDAIEQGCRAIDMLGNYAYYKQQWLATVTETESVQLFRKGTLVDLKALAGEAWRWLRPPVTQRDVDFNLDRKRAEDHGEASAHARPDRRAEQGRAQATFEAIEAAGGQVTRLGGDALRRALSPEGAARAAPAPAPAKPRRAAHEHGRSGTP